MNDLLDRKLKKLDHNIKYDHVPFDKDKTKMAVLEAPKTSRKQSYSWLFKAMPVPLLAALVIVCFQFDFSPSSSETHMAAQSPIKSNVTEMKTSIYAEPEMLSNNTEGKATMTKSQSTMVRETYVFHNDQEYIQTGRTVNQPELHEVIGTVKIEQVANEPLLEETKIYSIKGEDTDEHIAIQSRRNTGIGSTSISKQGYFVFEKR
ncbi:hypothetical protein [Halobacillus salinus]|uniref:Uncharacterized protein n=1 Tax=Halobacillus salinus TaxID=192814 RepID=A0A4Z0GVX7_9BACI|nr:hypothetical protein [Halobacillus salinus]TGB01905.1 hypothetical protein E4663_14820 [Halobacillus salinus]